MVSPRGYKNLVSKNTKLLLGIKYNFVQEMINRVEIKKRINEIKAKLGNYKPRNLPVYLLIKEIFRLICIVSSIINISLLAKSFSEFLLSLFLIWEK